MSPPPPPPRRKVLSESAKAAREKVLWSRGQSQAGGF